MESSNQEAAGKAPVKTSLEFEKHSVALAERYTLDVHEVRETYHDKPESLAAHYNAMSEASSGRNLWTFVGVLSFAVDTRNWRMGVAMLAVAAGFGFMNHRTLGKIGETVSNEIRLHHRKNTAGMAI